MSHSFGNTTNFQLDAIDSFWNGLSSARKANVAANATFLQGQVEAAFTTTTSWFGTDTTRFGTSTRQEVGVDQADGSGAFNNRYGSAIRVDSQSNNGGATGGPIVCALWMAEWSEILMSLTSDWNAGDSSGAGLSHWTSLQLFLAGHNAYYVEANNQIFVENWLDGDGTTNPGTAPPNSARSDWVNHTFTGADVSGTHVNGEPLLSRCSPSSVPRSPRGDGSRCRVQRSRSSAAWPATLRSIGGYASKNKAFTHNTYPVGCAEHPLAWPDRDSSKRTS